MGNADTRNHRRVAKHGWRAGEMVKASNSGAKKNRRDVDVDFLEEASIQALLDGVSAVRLNQDQTASKAPAKTPESGLR